MFLQGDRSLSLSFENLGLHGDEIYQCKLAEFAKFVHVVMQIDVLHFNATFLLFFRLYIVPTCYFIVVNFLIHSLICTLLYF